MGPAEIGGFLTWLAVERRVSASTQNQALGALLFLYRHVLRVEPDGIGEIVRATRPGRLPIVLTRAEARALPAHLDGVPRLMAQLLYGSGLRLLECAQLRVKDVDFGGRQIVVRLGKGDRDRVTMLPAALRDPLARHVDRVRRQHAADLARGAGWVSLPLAPGRKYPGAGREVGWQGVFRATRTYVDRETGERRGRHLHESVLQRAVKQALRAAGIAKPASCTRSGTRSQPTCWRTATTSGHCRSFSATRIWRRR